MMRSASVMALIAILIVGASYTGNVRFAEGLASVRVAFAATPARLGRPRSTLYVVNLATLSGQGGLQQARLTEANFEEIGPIRWWAPARTPSPTPSPALDKTDVDPAQSSLSVPPPEVTMPLLAWTIAPDDGAVFVMDAATNQEWLKRSKP